MSTHTCANCGNAFTGQFCNRCGQKEVHRITMKHLWHDVSHAFTHTDKGFFYMMGQLFVRPGVVAREYILEGKRKKYFPPFQYLVILAAIATIIVTYSHFVEYTFRSMEEITGNPGTQSARQAAMMQKIAFFQTKYYNILILIQLPFYSLAALIFYKRKYKYNYAELLTLQTFVTGTYTLISMTLMLTVFLTKSAPGYLNMIMILASLLYHTWVYTGFFKERNLVGILKAAGSHILGMVLFFLFAIILGMIIGLVIVIMNR